MAGASKKTVRCRICGSKELETYLRLGKTPLANSYLREEDLKAPEFKEELAIQLCLACGLSQLTRVVSPDRMFKHYLYVSSTTQTLRDHWEELARTAVSRAGMGPGDWALDIASNDGYLLSRFRELGMNIVGVEPAENLAREANAASIATVCAYWSLKSAREVARRFGSPKAITSTNVLAHVDDVHGFAKAVRECLAPDGLWIAEFPYLLNFIEGNEFDTAYHEHLSYIALHPLMELAERNGLEIVDAEMFEKLHGGTIRVFIGHRGRRRPTRRPAAFLRRERTFGIKKFSVYKRFAERVEKNKTRLLREVAKLRKARRTVWAYGASAKGNTLVNFFGLTGRELPCVIDDNPKKWGLYTPGARMKIVGIDALRENKVDDLLLLAWNFKDEIVGRCRRAGYRGRCIVPVPAVRSFAVSDGDVGQN